MATYETGTRTLISAARLKRKPAKRLYWALVILITVLFSLIFIGPLYWMVTGGLKSGFEVAHIPPTLYPKSPEFGNYKQAWTDLDIGTLILNTLYYVLGSLFFQLVLDVMAAYAFSKLRPVLGNIILGGMLATLMIPSTVMIIPQFVTVKEVPFFGWNLISTPWALWLPGVAANAFNIFLLKRFFDSIPNDLMSAAAIDGAGPLRTLWAIVLPMSRPILGVISIFIVTGVWKDFLWAKLVEPDAAHRTINVGITAFSGTLPQNVVIAGATIAAIPTILFFLVFQKNIMSGLTSGSLKG
jgi:multiple sugar transport system permease protein